MNQLWPWLNAAGLLLILTLLVRPLGGYMAAVFTGRPTFAARLVGPLERAIYRLCRIDPSEEMRWPTYAFALLAFTLASIVVTYAVLRTQAWLPLNPQHFDNLPPDLAWNTAVSFATTTDWQFYSGESTMSYLSQMLALAWQNFFAAAVGLASALALIRGLARDRSATVGNFWLDLTRGVLYVLLPLSVVFSLAFLWQGVPQNFTHYLDLKTFDGATQTITGGPMASQESIKLLGGNGGGFVAANSASPNENPTPLSNFLQLLAILLVPAALTYTFGRLVGDVRQGWALYLAMLVLFVGAVVIATPAELHGNPLIRQLGVAGPNLEGKEVRFGASNAGLSLAAASHSTTGDSNFTFDSLTPLSLLVAMVDMQLGEIAFGGVGSGLKGMLAFVVLTVFIAGLMVGRTPEYLGKKVERREILLTLLAILAFPLAILVPSAVACVIPQGTATLTGTGPHGFSEILYAFTSSAASNGSAMGGLGANTFYDVALGITMLLGRFAVIVPLLALAGAFAGKPRIPMTRGTLRTDTGLFVGLLVATVMIVGALTFLPGDALGPIVEQLRMLADRAL
ncbi:MAG: potassium-transporting ATPase subunit KdpA [Vulcanimicrobiaceae bacterium]